MANATNSMVKVVPAITMKNFDALNCCFEPKLEFM